MSFLDMAANVELPKPYDQIQSFLWDVFTYDYPDTEAITITLYPEYGTLLKAVCYDSFRSSQVETKITFEEKWAIVRNPHWVDIDFELAKLLACKLLDRAKEVWVPKTYLVAVVSPQPH